MVTDKEKQNWRSMISPLFFELVNHLESHDVQFSWKDNTNRRVSVQEHPGPERRSEAEEFQAIHQNEVLASEVPTDNLVETIEKVVREAVMHMRAQGVSIPFMDS